MMPASTVILGNRTILHPQRCENRSCIRSSWFTQSHSSHHPFTQLPTSQRRQGCRPCFASAIAEGGDDDDEDDKPQPDGDIARARQQLNRMMRSPGFTGAELRQLVFDKWGRSYDVCITKRGNRWFLHVMWKFLEQKSFHLTEEQYQEQLNAVAEMVQMWGVGDVVRAGIVSGRSRGPGYSAGGSAQAVSIPLPVESTARQNLEWDSRT